jgi:hypothetical protein
MKPTERPRPIAGFSFIRPVRGREATLSSKKTRKCSLGWSMAAGLLFLSAPLLAQDKPAKGVITLAEVTIVGRIQKPIASVDVNRIQPKLTLQELRQPFLEKIEKAIYQQPF